MLIEIGHVEAIFRYPIKSMGGERLESANLGWHGLDGDRRLAFRRIDYRSGFPWLTAGKLPDLRLFAPKRRAYAPDEDLPAHIRAPDGEEMFVFGEDLAAEVGRRYGGPVQMTAMKHGIIALSVKFSPDARPPVCSTIEGINGADMDHQSLGG